MSEPMRASDGREVCDVEVEGQGCDAYISKASYRYGPAEVPDDELDYLTETYPEFVDETAYEAACGVAEAYYEGDR